MYLFSFLLGQSSLTQLQEMGISQELARRLLEKKALFLTRMDEEDIARLHEADLLNRFQVHIS